VTDHQAVSAVLQTDTEHHPIFHSPCSLIGSYPLRSAIWSGTMAARYIIFCMAKHQLSSLTHRSVFVPRSPLFMKPQISPGCHYTALYLQSLTVHAGCCAHSIDSNLSASYSYFR